MQLQWHSLSREEQAKYYDQARKERQLHMQMYPGWSARDNYAQSKEVDIIMLVSTFTFTFNILSEHISNVKRNVIMVTHYQKRKRKREKAGEGGGRFLC